MPAENAAMANKVHPKAWTYDNIAAMKAQLKSMGLSLDWSREIATCDPAYYRHQQKLFLDFWQAGLVERKSSKVNWDPVDHTVLANEQVIDGRGWRSGAEVEQRELTQWFFKISNYSEDLLQAIDTLDRWPEKVRLMQKNWIGRSEGLLVRFALAPKNTPKGFDEIEVFTTRHDTLFGASFIAIAPDHPLAKSLAERDPKVAAFIEECRRHGTAQEVIDKAEKKGIDTGLRAMHPFDREMGAAGLCRKLHPDGLRHRRRSSAARPTTSATSTSPANTSFRCLPVVVPEGADPKTFAVHDEAYHRGRQARQFTLPRRHERRDGQGRSRPPARARTARQPASGRAARAVPAARLGHFAPALLGLPDPGDPLRDLRCGAGAGRRILPVTLPEDVTFDRPGNPLDRHPTWKHVPCPRCGRPARRETDTMDTFVDSSWYFLRFTAPDAKTPTEADAVRLLDAGRPIYRRRRARDPASALFALLHPRHEGDRPRRISTSRSTGSSRRAWSCTRPIGAKAATGLSPPKCRIERMGDARRAFLISTGERVEIGPTREDVEVQAQHRRSRRHPLEPRRRHRALVHAFRLAARARRDLDRGWRAGRLSLHAAALAASPTISPTSPPPRAPRGPRNSAPQPRPCARRPMRHLRTSARTSSGCASTAASPTSTGRQCPIRSPFRGPRGRRRSRRPRLVVPRGGRNPDRNRRPDDAASS